MSPAQVERFLAVIRDQGVSIPTACAMAGVSFRWVQNRRSADPRFGDALAEALAPALGEVHDAVKKAATRCDDHGRFDVRAQELFLRLHDEDYRAQLRAERGVPAKAVQVNVAPVVLSAEERLLIGELARRRLGIGPDAAASPEDEAAAAAQVVEAQPESAGKGSAPHEVIDAAGS